MILYIFLKIMDTERQKDIIAIISILSKIHSSWGDKIPPNLVTAACKRQSSKDDENKRKKKKAQNNA